ncbi:MAG: peptide deformylase [bacterium]|nr:peptide deformylase [bacterium]
MNILTIKNKKEESVLRVKTAPFDFAFYTKPQITELLRTMRTTMTAASGVGLAANQIGLNSSVFVALVHNKFYAVFNPVITEMSVETEMLDEGCLSVPGTYGPTSRAARVTLIGADRNSRPLKIKARGLLARVFQHEVDHLNGVLFIDKAKELHKISNI